MRELTGQQFGRLTVLEYAGRTPKSHRLWKCLCECGTETIVHESNLVAGKTKSCGCLARHIQPKEKPIPKNQSRCFSCKAPMCDWLLSTPEQRERYGEWPGMKIRPKNVRDNQTKLDRRYTIYIVQECVYAR